jgi:hypothetical protein
MGLGLRIVIDARRQQSDWDPGELRAINARAWSLIETLRGAPAGESRVRLLQLTAELVSTCSRRHTVEKALCGRPPLVVDMVTAWMSR